MEIFLREYIQFRPHPLWCYRPQPSRLLLLCLSVWHMFITAPPSWAWCGHTPSFSSDISSLTDEQMGVSLSSSVLPQSLAQETPSAATQRRNPRRGNRPSRNLGGRWTLQEPVLDGELLDPPHQEPHDPLMSDAGEEESRSSDLFVGRAPADQIVPSQLREQEGAGRSATFSHYQKTIGDLYKTKATSGHGL